MEGRRALVAIAFVGLAACAAISGAGDLVVDPSVGASDAASDGAAHDAAAPIDAGSDLGAPPPPPLVEAGVDASADAGPTRVRTVTFEGAMSLTGPQGADAVVGAAMFVTGLGVPDGAGAMKTGAGPAYVVVTNGVAGLSEIYLSFLVSIDNVDPNGAFTPMMTLLLAGGHSVSIVVSDPPGSFGVSIDGNPPTGALPYTQKNLYRMGLHYQDQQVEVWFDETPATPFGPVSFKGSSTTLTGLVHEIQLGAIDGNFRVNAVFDDLLVDTASMPP